MITDEQKAIARKEADFIIKEYRDSQDEDELREGVYEAIIEALKHNSTRPTPKGEKMEVNVIKLSELQANYYKQTGKECHTEEGQYSDEYVAWLQDIARGKFPSELSAQNQELRGALRELVECDYTSGTHLSTALIRGRKLLNTKNGEV